MPFASVEKLSDDEHIEKPKVETAKPTPTLKPPPTPKPVAVKAKAKSKSLPMKKQPTDDTPEEQTEEPAPKATATMKRPAAARNPAGSSGNPPDSPRPPALKRPAAAKVELKATKYKYHKKNMWGIKLNGKEMVTVKHHPDVSDEKQMEVAEACRVELERGATKEQVKTLAETMMSQAAHAEQAREARGVGAPAAESDAAALVSADAAADDSGGDVGDEEAEEEAEKEHDDAIEDVE